jgi:hypothetical protein
MVKQILSSSAINADEISDCPIVSPRQSGVCYRPICKLSVQTQRTIPREFSRARLAQELLHSGRFRALNLKLA